MVIASGILCAARASPASSLRRFVCMCLLSWEPAYVVIDLNWYEYLGCSAICILSRSILTFAHLTSRSTLTTISTISIDCLSSKALCQGCSWRQPKSNYAKYTLREGILEIISKRGELLKILSNSTQIQYSHRNAPCGSNNQSIHVEIV